MNQLGKKHSLKGKQLFTLTFTNSILPSRAQGQLWKISCKNEVIIEVFTDCASPSPWVVHPCFTEFHSWTYVLSGSRWRHIFSFSSQDPGFAHQVSSWTSSSQSREDAGKASSESALRGQCQVLMKHCHCFPSNVTAPRSLGSGPTYVP